MPSWSSRTDIESWPAIVVIYVFLAALGAFEPTEVIEVTIAVVLLAALLLTHEWREQFRDEGS